MKILTLSFRNTQLLSILISPPSDQTKTNFTEIDCFKTTMVEDPDITISRQTLTENTTGVFIDDNVQDAWESQ